MHEYCYDQEAGCRQAHENLDHEEGPEISKTESMIWLAIVTIAISVLSDYLVDTMEVGNLSCYAFKRVFVYYYGLT